MGDPLGSKVRVGGARLPWVTMVAASQRAWPSLTAGVSGEQAFEQLIEVHGAGSNGEWADHSRLPRGPMVDCVDQPDSLKLYTIC
ncbi:hypothetical protein PspCFBP13528_08870 [Pseudomonas sp. CFBP13528]|uniref:Uncharacterized protein n=1 Tax=Pseudomonas fluorescens TaxID=294 RepID=A0A2N1ECT4_PSEFL|nr:hypothetical protein CIB54_05280 [Pseudomonas fluorescens]TKK33797.1 hypothetical protein PspCFBP13528_08870 [Pseudomonas sp. CFBP13528]